MRVGVAVYCQSCNQQKKPVGRDACIAMCTGECPGYYAPPFVGNLWPRETDIDYGFPAMTYGSKEVDDA